MKTSYIKLFIGIAAVLFTSTAWSQSTPAGGSCDSGDCLTTFAWTEDSNDPKMASGLAQDATCGVALNASVTYTGNDPSPVFDNVSFNAANQVQGSGTPWTDEWEVNFTTSLSSPILDFNNLFPDTQVSITDCSGTAISLTKTSDNSTIASGSFSGTAQVQLNGTHGCIKVTLSNDKRDGYEVKVTTCLNTPPPPSNITAIGTCAGITAANENKYNVVVSGLDAGTTYNIDYNGDGTADAMNVSGSSTYTSSTSISYVDGSASTTVKIDAGADGTYETTIIVHEVLCTDADNDGTLDHNKSGCDVSTMVADQGYIVATVAPYTGNNVYVYVLTNPNDKALAANFSGLFTGLASGGTPNVDDYNVIAFNLPNLADAQAYLSTLTLDPTTGTSVTASSSSTGCSAACGSMSYNIECCVQPVATVNDPAICEKSTTATLTGNITTGTVNNYSIDFDDNAITDISSTAYPGNNEIAVTLPNNLAPGDYTGTITFIDYVGCSGTDAFTITVNPEPTASISGTTTICTDDSAPIFTFSGTPNAVVTYKIDGGASTDITLNASGTALLTASNTASSTVTLESVELTSTGCSKSITGSATVTVNPLPTVAISGTNTICAGSLAPDFTFTGTADAVVTYNIDGGSNTTINLDGSGSATITASNTESSTVNLVSVSLTATSCTQNVSGSATVTVNDPIVVEAGSGPDVCSTGTIDLTALNATISGGHTGTWTSNGSGSFNNGGVLGSATTYTPSPADIAMGSVVLTLTSADPTGPCDASFDMVTITILNVACGSFPWDGSND